MLRVNKIKIGLRLSDDERICNVLCMLVLGLYIVNISPGFEEALGTSHAVVSGIVKVILGVGFILCVDVVLRRLKRSTLFFCLITIMVMFLSMVFFPYNNIVFKKTALYFLGNCFLPIIFFKSVFDFECLRKKMVRTSEIIAILTIIILILSVITIGSGFKFSLGVYAMGFGYACLVPWLLLAMEFIKKPTLKQGTFMLVILAAIMSFGSRGPLLSIASFLILVFVKVNHERKKNIQILLGFFIGIIFVLFSSTLFTFLNYFLSSIGIESRTLILLSQNIGHLSGRGELYRFFLKEILANPFYIHGINGEQALGFNYPHNIFLELLYQFGVILGGAISFAIVFNAIKTLKLSQINVDSKQQLETVFMCASLPNMMVSDTLWKQINFWIWIAISSIRQKDNKKRSKEGNY